MTTARAAEQIAIAAVFRSGARYSMNAINSGRIITRLNCDPIASARETPSSRMRRQFHNTTSRGAYSVCETAIAVNTAPNVPQAPVIFGAVFTAIAVSHTLYAPREVVL